MTLVLVVLSVMTLGVLWWLVRRDDLRRDLPPQTDALDAFEKRVGAPHNRPPRDAA